MVDEDGCKEDARCEICVREGEGEGGGGMPLMLMRDHGAVQQSPDCAGFLFAVGNQVS